MLASPETGLKLSETCRGGRRRPGNPSPILSAPRSPTNPARVRAAAAENCVRRRLLVLVAATAACPTLLFGASEDATPTVLVTATRLNDEVRDLPSAITILNADDIARTPARNLPELLGLQAGVTTRSLYGNNAARDSVDLRGFGATGGQNTLILLNGRRLNDVDLAAVDFSAIPLASIERVEIIRGGGAVLYGDGAVGGTINIVTRDAGPAGTRASGNVSYGSYRTWGGDAAANHRGGPLASRVAASYLSSDGYRDNNQLQKGTAQADVRGAYQWGEWFVQLAGDKENLRLPGARRVDPVAGIDELATDPRGTGTPNDYANQDGVQLAGGLSLTLSPASELVIDAGIRNKRQLAFYDDYLFGGLFTSYVDTELTTWSITPRYKRRVALLGDHGGSVLGVDFYRSTYDSRRSPDRSTVASPLQQLDVRQDSAAIYAQQTEGFGATTFTLGARLQEVRQQGRDLVNPSTVNLDQRDREHMLEAGVRQGLGQYWSLFVKGSRSVRFATVDELFRPYSVPDFVALKPQIGRGADTGIDYRRGALQTQLSIYYLELDNEIHYNPVTYSNENLDPTRRHGFNLSVATALMAHVRLSADYAYTRAEFRDGPFAGNEVPLVPQHTAALTLHWKPQPSTDVALAGRYVGSKYFDSDETNDFSQKIPAYEVLDLRLTETLERWRFQAAVYNIFNKQFFDYGVRSTSNTTSYAAYPMPGRNFMLTLGREF